MIQVHAYNEQVRMVDRSKDHIWIAAAIVVRWNDVAQIVFQADNWVHFEGIVKDIEVIMPSPAADDDFIWTISDDPEMPDDTVDDIIGIAQMIGKKVKYEMSVVINRTGAVII